MWTFGFYSFPINLQVIPGSVFLKPDELYSSHWQNPSQLLNAGFWGRRKQTFCLLACILQRKSFLLDVALISGRDFQPSLCVFCFFKPLRALWGNCAGESEILFFSLIKEVEIFISANFEDYNPERASQTPLRTVSYFFLSKIRIYNSNGNEAKTIQHTSLQFRDREELGAEAPTWDDSMFSAEPVVKLVLS